MPSITATLIMSGRERRVTMAAPVLPGAREKRRERVGERRRAFVSNEHDHVYSGRTSAANQPARQAKGRQGGISASGRNKVYFESATGSPGVALCRRIPHHRSTAARRASVQVRRSLLHRRTLRLSTSAQRTQTDSSATPRGGEEEGEGGDDEAEKQSETGDETSGTRGRGGTREGWSSRRW